jgi:amino acid transporter
MNTEKNISSTQRKSIGLLAAVSIGIGGMVGAGIFSILGIATQISGNKVYISFIIAGLVALLSTYSYAKLGSKFPSSGGPVEFLVKGFGDGILSGGFNILLWIGYIFALALYARAFGGYAATFLPTGVSGLWVNVLASAIILLFMAINFFGAKAVGRSEIVIVVVKVIILLLFAGIGIIFAKSELLSLSHWPHFSNMLFGAAMVFLAYEGFGLITNAAEDIPDPKKTLPRALYLSVCIVIAIYVLVSFAVIGNLSVPAITRAKDYALAQAARPFLGMVGFKIIAIAALFSTASAINATLFGGANVSYMIAKEGELPALFERKFWGRATEGLFITSGLVLLFANFLQLDKIAMLGSASFLVIYGVVNIAHLRLYRETGAKPILIWLSIFCCFASLGALFYYEGRSSPLTLIVFGIVIALSFCIELVYRRLSKRKLKTRK